MPYAAKQGATQVSDRRNGIFPSARARRYSAVKSFLAKADVITPDGRSRITTLPNMGAMGPSCVTARRYRLQQARSPDNNTKRKCLHTLDTDSKPERRQLFASILRFKLARLMKKEAIPVLMNQLNC